MGSCTPVPCSLQSRSAGFTLLELTVVLALIAIIMAVAMPSLLPAIVFSRHEGAARHLANYGRAVMAQCALAREYVTVKIDLDNQEYWSVRWIETTEALFDEGSKESKESKQAAMPSLSSSANKAEEQLAAEAEFIQQQIDQLVRMSIKARSRNVRHEGILSDIGPLFEEKLDLDGEEEQSTEEIMSDLLARVKLDSEVCIETVIVGDVEHTKGTVEVNVTPLGLSEWVTFYIKNQEDEYFTVIWDPIAGNTRLIEGKEVRG